MDAWFADIRALLGEMTSRTQLECRRKANVPLDVWARIVLGRLPNQLPLPVGPWILDFDVHPTPREHSCTYCEEKGEPCERISTRKVSVGVGGGGKTVLSIFCRGCFFAGKARCGYDERGARLLDKWVGLVKAQDDDDEEEEGGDVAEGSGDEDEQEQEPSGAQDMQLDVPLPPPVMGEFSIDTEHGVLSGRSMSMAPPRSLPPSTNVPPARAMSMAPARTLDKTSMGPPTSSPQARLIDRLERDVEKQTQELELKEEELRVVREGLKAKEVALRTLEMELEEAARKKREEAERWQREEREREAEVQALKAENERIARKLDEATRNEQELRAMVDVVRRTVNVGP